MRIRETECNCSFTISFEEFEDKFIECSAIVFTEDYEHFSVTDFGIVVQEFDVFWESEDERVKFIDWVKELGF